MQIRDVDSAWAAGFLDGEGCFSISPVVGSKTRHSCRISAANTNKEPLELLQQLFGGFVYELSKGPKDKNPNHKRSYQFNITKTTDATKLVEAILPYLVVKKSQAILMLKFLKVPFSLGTKQTNEQVALKKQMYEDMKLLNKKGPPK